MSMKLLQVLQLIETDDDINVDSDKDNIQDDLIELASDGKLVASEVTGIADKYKIDIGIVEQYILELLCATLTGIGKHRKVPDSKFDKKQLEMGMAEELEHTNHPYIAKIIAKDHLVSDAKYYTRLGKMEKRAGVKG